jgi:uncharacterized membrane protein YdjX (TVP38/TMEM64 family)
VRSGGQQIRRWTAAALFTAGAAALIASRSFNFDVASATAGARSFAALHTALAAAGFFLAYAVITALAIPVVAAMTIAAGALFGPWLGAPLAVVSSAAGATIAMLIVRYALRDRILARFPELSKRFGGPGSGAALLFAARVTPVLPFALVNAAAGVSGMPARTFALVSAAGAAPLAFLYVSAGAVLGAVGGPSDIVSPRLLALLTLAGATPLAARYFAARLARRAALRFARHV